MTLATLSKYNTWADKALVGEQLSRDEALDVLNTPDEELEQLLESTRRVREKYFGRRVKVCVLLNAQSGICPEDCNYCSQSKISKASVEKYKLMTAETIVDRARQAASTGAKRFCIVMAARGPQDKDIDHLCEATRQIKSETGIDHLEICLSLGLMDLEKCQRLKAAGVDYVNHNLNTSEEHYADICSTHTYADRVATINNIKEAGLHTCSGGIVGMGETLDDIVDMSFSFREMDIESIPINFLLGIPGTPLENQKPIEPHHGLKVLCLMRLQNPDKEVRVAAGREVHLKNLQHQALAAANSLFVDGYLTEPGDSSEKVKLWLESEGYELEA
jgi:biotin synthase